MTPRLEDVESPVVGKFYIVPVVFHRTWKREVAIYGPAHEDKEFLNFEDIHWHVDWRFASKRFYDHKRLSRSRGISLDECNRYLHGIVANRELCNAPYEKKRKMMRETPPYPRADTVPWLKKLEEAFTFHRLPRCRTCPHKGISLKHVKPNAQGLVTCTGHGLTWNVNTGMLVRGT